MCIINLFRRMAFEILFNCQWFSVILLVQSILHDIIFALLSVAKITNFVNNQL